MIDFFNAYFQGAKEYFDPTPGMPAHLYKYMTANRAINMLLTGTLYFAKRKELNDPFDGRPVLDFSSPEKIAEITALAEANLLALQRRGIRTDHVVPPQKQRREHQKLLRTNPDFAEKITRQLVEDMDRTNLGIFCMTSENDSFPMWAHYAGQHAGCCVRFDTRGLQFDHKWNQSFPFVRVGKIRYSHEYPKFPDAAKTPPYEHGSFYMTKSDEWKYESEWRAVMYDGQVTTPITGMSFPSEMADVMRGSGAYSAADGLIDGVILGHNISETDKSAVIAAAKLRQIKVYQAEPKLYEYGMDINPLPRE